MAPAICPVSHSLRSGKAGLRYICHWPCTQKWTGPSRVYPEHKGPGPGGISGHLAWHAQAQDCSRHQASLMKLSMPVGACFPMPTQACHLDVGKQTAVRAGSLEQICITYK